MLTWSCAPLCPVRCVPVLSRQPGDWWEWKEQRADPPDLERPVKGFPGHCRPLPPGSTPGSQVGRGQTHFLILSNHSCFHSLSQGAQISLFFFKAASINYLYGMKPDRFKADIICWSYVSWMVSHFYHKWRNVCLTMFGETNQVHLPQYIAPTLIHKH